MKKSVLSFTVGVVVGAVLGKVCRVEAVSESVREKILRRYEYLCAKKCPLCGSKECECGKIFLRYGYPDWDRVTEDDFEMN